MGLLTDIRAMGPREIVRGLMRGDPAKFKAGYTAANAVIAAGELRDLSRRETEFLRAYAEGYAAGLAEGRGDD